ncbi:tetratricopeptide repeat protein [Streptomyces sp. NPDC054932]
MTLIRAVWDRLWASGLVRADVGRRQRTALEEIGALIREDRYEEAERAARAFAVHPRRTRDRSPAARWSAVYLAVVAAIAHGRGAEVLPELEALIAEVKQDAGSWQSRSLLLDARLNRVSVLVDAERLHEAEAEALDILRASTRIAHAIETWETELCTLLNLAHALCELERYEEAEEIARGNLARAEGRWRASFNIVLVEILNGRGRHAEALAQAREPMPSARRRSTTGALELGVAAALHGTGRHEEALDTARQALHACEQTLHPAHPRIKHARALLARMAPENPENPTDRQAD